MNKRLFAFVPAALISSLAMAQQSQPAQAAPVRADSVAATSATTASQEELQSLRQEVSRLQAQVQELKANNNKPAAPVRAEPAVTAARSAPMWPAPPGRIESQPALPAAPAAAPAPIENAPMAQLPAYASADVSHVKVASTREFGSPGLTVTADITLRDVPNVPFVMQAVLVTPDEKIHTDARSKPYIATREVMTGDQDDTDDYSVFLDLGNLFSSRPPEDLFVQVRVTDLRGNIVAKSELHSFRRPWQ